MPWKVMHAMDQRHEMFLQYEAGESIAELSRLYQVSRPTIYKWIERYQQQGPAGLNEHSRAPHGHPQQHPEATRQRILELRRQHARWGPRKLKAYLEARDDEPLPATSTIGSWLKQEGLAQPRHKRRRTPPMKEPLAHAQEPNQVWCADFKGWFRTEDQERIDPLTLTDAASRYLLRCVAVSKTDGRAVRSVMEAAFREFGLPEAIRTDNGAPFASPAPAGLSRLALWWIRLGIRPERIEPGKPQQNGRHERFHLTLKQETAAPPRASRAAQQRSFLAFQKIYNEQRPHEALHYATPDSRYVASERRMPSRLPEPAFPTGCVTRKISQQGSLKWRGERTFISEVLAREPVGLLRADDRYWELYYGPVLVGWFDGRSHRFHPLHRRPRDLHWEER
jgi:transposase InsO family protein